MLANGIPTLATSEGAKSKKGGYKFCHQVIASTIIRNIKLNALTVMCKNDMGFKEKMVIKKPVIEGKINKFELIATQPITRNALRYSKEKNNVNTSRYLVDLSKHYLYLRESAEIFDDKCCVS